MRKSLHQINDDSDVIKQNYTVNDKSGEIVPGS